MTPALVTFGEDQRYIGQSAAAQFKRNVVNTVTNVKRLIGRKFKEEDVQRELPYLAFNIKEIEDGEIGIEVMSEGSKKILTPVQICGALLGQLKRTAEDSLGQEVRDVCLSVPHWWNDRQRRAMMDASAIAGLNCLQLVNELTGCAIELGIRKDKTLEKDQSELVCFFDMGDSQTQCAIMRFSKGKFEVLGYGSDHHLGGRNFTSAIADHFIEEWKAKYKIDVNTNARAKLRVKEAAQAVKHTLSANAWGNVNLDCLINDKDVTGRLDRDAFVAMIQPLLERILEPIKNALESAGLKKEDIVTVEVVGDSHRIPAIGAKLEEFFGKPPSKRTNATEAVAKGAAWQCARRSPLFRVVPYEVKDLQPYPMVFQWTWGTKAGEQEPTSSVVFPHHTVVPVFKQVSFKKQFEEGMTFTVSARYEEGTVLPPGTSKHLGQWKISSIPVDTSAMVEGEKAVLKVGCKLDESGIVLVARAEKEWSENQEYEVDEEVPITEEEATPAEQPAAAAPQAPTDGAAAPEGSSTDTPAAAAPTAAADSNKKEEQPKQPKTKKIKVQKKRVVARSAKLEVHPFTPSLSAETINRLRELELEMNAHDRLVVDTAAEKNRVEAYVYEAREKLSAQWVAFATEEQKNELSALCESIESWLYSEGERQQKSAYSEKLGHLKKIGDPIALRAREAEERGPASKELRDAVQRWLDWADTKEEAYAHIEAADREQVRTKATAALTWLDEALIKQASHSTTEPPLILSSEIESRRSSLDKECGVIKNKPKPKPAPVPEKKAEKTDAPGPKTEEQAKEEAPPAAEQEEEKKPADQDPDTKPEDMDTAQ